MKFGLVENGGVLARFLHIRDRNLNSDDALCIAFVKIHPSNFIQKSRG